MLAHRQIGDLSRVYPNFLPKSAGIGFSFPVDLMDNRKLIDGVSSVYVFQHWKVTW